MARSHLRIVLEPWCIGCGQGTVINCRDLPTIRNVAASQVVLREGQDVSTPDYPLEDSRILTDAAQYRALFEDTRKEIVSLLLERAATTTELAAVLGKPKGTVGHHLNVLAEAGLVHVVRTEQVRGFTAKYYGRTARVFLYEASEYSPHDVSSTMGKAAAQIADSAKEFDIARVNAYNRYSRLTADQYVRWHERIKELLLEFMNENVEGEQTHALVVGLYPVNEPRLGDTNE